MMKPTYCCDVCGAIKLASNHWLRCAKLLNGAFIIQPWGEPMTTLAHCDTEQHLCGLGCATKAMLRALGGEQGEVAR